MLIFRGSRSNGVFAPLPKPVPHEVRNDPPECSLHTVQSRRHPRPRLSEHPSKLWTVSTVTNSNHFFKSRLSLYFTVPWYSQYSDKGWHSFCKQHADLGHCLDSVLSISSTWHKNVPTYECIGTFIHTDTHSDDTSLYLQHFTPPHHLEHMTPPHHERFTSRTWCCQVGFLLTLGSCSSWCNSNTMGVEVEVEVEVEGKRQRERGARQEDVESDK